MLRAWRNEVFCLLSAGLVLLLLGAILGHTEGLLGIGLAAYLGWHLFNLSLLYRWIAYSHRFRLPVTFGIWEAVFDGLQRRQLLGRRRRRGLMRRLREFRNAEDRLPDALVLLKDDRSVLWFNAAAAKLLGLRRPQDLGRDVTELIRHPALEDALFGSGTGRSLEVASPANGAWMLSIQTTRAFGTSRRRMLVARDVTASYRLEQVRRDFVANVSHELRTPVTVFRGYLGALRDKPPASRWEVPLARMDEQARRMQNLVDGLLFLSRLEMSRRAPLTDLVPVPAMLESIRRQAQVLSGTKGHELVLEVDPSVFLIGDEDELHSAFSNLVFNAVRHTPPGTRVTVSWEGDQDRACLAVRDSGPGIAARHLPRLTERFYRVDDSRSRQDGGTGLGLAIVKHVLERHDADLRITSEPGLGCTFSCQFPGARVDLEETKALAPASA